VPSARAAPTSGVCVASAALAQARDERFGPIREDRKTRSCATALAPGISMSGQALDQASQRARRVRPRASAAALQTPASPSTRPTNGGGSSESPPEAADGRLDELVLRDAEQRADAHKTTYGAAEIA
jgi:hypothetical protein